MLVATSVTAAGGDLREHEETHMGIFTRHGLTVPDAGPSFDPRTSRITAGLHSTLPPLGYGAALAIGLSALVFVPPDRSTEEVVRLERLAPEIERARALPPETKESINRLVARQSLLVGTGSQSYETRRKAAIDRVTSAMRAKEGGSAGRSIADAAIQ
jgi:hypothetical protein